MKFKISFLSFLFVSSLFSSAYGQSRQKLIGSWQIVMEEGQESCQKDATIVLNGNGTAYISYGSRIAECEENKEDFSAWKYAEREGESKVKSIAERQVQHDAFEDKKEEWKKEDEARKKSKADRKKKKKKRSLLSSLDSAADRLSSVGERTTAKLDRFDEKTTLKEENTVRLLGLKGVMGQTLFEIKEFGDNTMVVVGEVTSGDSTTSKEMTFKKVK